MSCVFLNKSHRCFADYSGGHVNASHLAPDMVGEGGAYGFRGSFEAGKGQGSADVRVSSIVSLLTCSDTSLPAGGAIVASTQPLRNLLLLRFWGF